MKFHNCLHSSIQLNRCCRKVEIFCPCSEKELESIVNFLYQGAISYSEAIDVANILCNLTKIFGFPENLFTLEDCTMLNGSDFESELQYSEDNADIETFDKRIKYKEESILIPNHKEKINFAVKIYYLVMWTDLHR